MKKISIVVVLTLSLLWLSGAQAQISSVPDAINKAGRQRMLTQRILRDYIQLGMEVRPDIAAKELPEAMSLFDSTLVDLKRFASDKAVASALADVERLWKPVKAVATTTPDRDKAEQLWLDTENLLIACNTLVQRLEDASDDPGNYLVNTAGLQRMLSQRAVVFHMMRAWGFSNPRYEKGFNETQSHFKLALEELIDHEQTSAEIRSKLEEVQKLFVRFEKGAQGGTNNFVLGMMANSAHKILNNLNDIVARYEALVGNKG
ncbi:MAG: hypothetical protein ETSY2_39455 [Candidatus Entotheonella gemina]|uniref:NarX-like N-terminal domain-containing protein n=1 Tax=Candidatus Entotheonella gemina TaxID=1429439 RepID=W4LQB2_9BACT|nr:MAG: hypothetical protein ETSY2_39455 [Candidatus Entotheonella gemina]